MTMVRGQLMGACPWRSWWDAIPPTSAAAKKPAIQASSVWLLRDARGERRDRWLLNAASPLRSLSRASLAGSGIDRDLGDGTSLLMPALEDPGVGPVLDQQLQRRLCGPGHGAVLGERDALGSVGVLEVGDEVDE